MPMHGDGFAEPMPVDFSHDTMEIHLLDPSHDPRDFPWLLSRAYGPILDEPLRQTLLLVLRDAKRREGIPYSEPVIINEDGTETPMVSGRDYLR